MKDLPPLRHQPPDGFAESVLHRGSLLQHTELPVAPQITTPEKIPQTILKNMLDLGRQLCDVGYHLVAFTQFSTNILNQWQIPLDLSNVVYVSTAASNYLPFFQALLINPSLLEDEGLTTPQIEACGSILKGQATMWIRRPKFSLLTAHVWSDQGDFPRAYSRFLSSGVGMLQHEIDHLHGRTALDRPDQFVDFTTLKDKDDWHQKHIWNWGPYDPVEEMAAISKEWITWDNPRQLFHIVDPSGKHLRNF